MKKMLYTAVLGLSLASCSKDTDTDIIEMTTIEVEITSEITTEVTTEPFDWDNLNDLAAAFEDVALSALELAIKYELIETNPRDGGLTMDQIVEDFINDAKENGIDTSDFNPATALIPDDVYINMLVKVTDSLGSLKDVNIGFKSNALSLFCEQDGKHWAVINEDIFDRASDQYRKYLVYHELGHGYLNYHHHFNDDRQIVEGLEDGQFDIMGYTSSVNDRTEAEFNEAVVRFFVEANHMIEQCDGTLFGEEIPEIFPLWGSNYPSEFNEYLIN